MTVASLGGCEFCGGIFSKRGIKRHLDACRVRPVDEGGNKPYYTLRIEGYPQNEYWLYIEMRGDALLVKLDQFLRSIWLECCGHLSMFTINGRRYLSDDHDDYDEDMEIELEEVVRIGDVFTHDYDFGSTTTLKVKVVSARLGYAGEGAVTLLARNIEPEEQCDFCGNRAEYIDGVQGRLACTACVRRRGDNLAEYWLPLVNSPRTGVCGYTGD